MDTWFELWNTESGNIVGDFDSEEAALQFVRTSFGSFGPRSVDSLVLVKEASDESQPETIAMGNELAELARRHRHGAKS